MVGLGTSRGKSLSDIPPELVLVIFDFLSIVDRNCLSRCSRRHHNLYRIYSNTLLPLTRAETLFILLRIERDLPEYFACCVCFKLHQYDGTESFGLSGLAEKKTSTLPCDYKGSNPEHELTGRSSMSMRTHINYLHSGSRLYNIQVKLAMRRFHYGPKSGISTESISYTQIRTYLHAIRETSHRTTLQYQYVPTLFSREAQICPEPLGLYVRMQDILLYKTWEDSKVDLIINPLQHYEICCHQTLFSKRHDLDQVKKGKKIYLAYTCSRCTVVCHIEIIELDCRVCLIMTRWFNLGNGADHNDPLWRAHSYGCTEGPNIPQNLRSARLCFEDQAPETFDRLRERNLSYLKGAKYKKGYPFVKNSRDLWHISYKDPSARPLTTRKLFEGWVCAFLAIFCLLAKYHTIKTQI